VSLALDGTVNSEQLPQNKIPLVEYNDEKSEATVPDSQATYTITFTNYTPGDLYEMNYGGIVSADDKGVPVEYRYADPLDPGGNRNPDIIFAGLRNISIINTTSIVTDNDPDYTITITGSNAGKHMQFFTINSANSQAFVSIDNETVISGTEPAWSYPYVVTREPSTDPGNTHYYQCKVPHLADPSGGPFVNQPGDGSDWQTYWDDIGSDPTAGPWPNQPAWFEWQHRGEAAADQITGDWNYLRGDGDPVAGQITHQNLNTAEMRVSITDNAVVDRSAELALLVVGDTIVVGTQTWEILTLSNNTTHYTFTVRPAEQLDADSLVSVTFNYRDPTGWNPWAGNTAAGNRIYSPWDRGFPTVAGFHEQRLIFAASKEATTTLWGSRVGHH
jgi:hypothetical protein